VEELSELADVSHSVVAITGQFDDAICTLDRAIALLSISWQVYYEMSYALLGKGDFLGALRQAERASSLGAWNYPDLHLVKAYCS
jgi:hypothetical protein